MEGGRERLWWRGKGGSVVEGEGRQCSVIAMWWRWRGRESSGEGGCGGGGRESSGEGEGVWWMRKGAGCSGKGKKWLREREGGGVNKENRKVNWKKRGHETVVDKKNYKRKGCGKADQKGE